MKTKHFTLAIAFASILVILTSCGGHKSKLANKEQVKSYILMTSADFSVHKNYVDEYIQRLEQGKVKDVFVPDVKSYQVGDDIIDENPWLQKTHIVLLGSTWTLDPESSLLKDWNSNSRYNYSWYAEEHQEDDSVVGLSVIHAWVKFIQKKSDKVVKIYDQYYSKNDSTKSAEAYYVIYTIDKNYYVLVRLTEEKKTSRFEIETLARGESLIEIERKLEYYM